VVDACRAILACSRAELSSHRAVPYFLVPFPPTEGLVLHSGSRYIWHRKNAIAFVLGAVAKIVLRRREKLLRRSGIPLIGRAFVPGPFLFVFGAPQRLIPAFCSISARCARRTLRTSAAGGRSAIRAMSSASSCHALPHFIKRTASATMVALRSAVGERTVFAPALAGDAEVFGAAARAARFGSGSRAAGEAEAVFACV